MVEILDATATRYQEELQELVEERYEIRLIIRQEQQEYLETSLNPRLAIIEVRENHRTEHNWYLYGREKDETRRRNNYMEEGFDKDFRIASSDVDSGQPKLDDEGGWNSPKNAAQVIEDSTEDLYLSFWTRGGQEQSLFREITKFREEIEEEGYMVRIENINSYDNRPVVSVKRRETLDRDVAAQEAETILETAQAAVNMAQDRARRGY